MNRFERGKDPKGSMGIGRSSYAIGLMDIQVRGSDGGLFTLSKKKTEELLNYLVIHGLWMKNKKARDIKGKYIPRLKENKTHYSWNDLLSGVLIEYSGNYYQMPNRYLIFK